MSGLRIIFGADAEPVTLEEVKEDLRVDHTDDDARLTRHITEARQWVERRIQKLVAQQTWEQLLDGFPATDTMILPVYPVSEIVHIKYNVPDDEFDVTMPPEDYFFDPLKNTILVLAGVWPGPLAEGINTVRVRFVAGVLPDEVPGPVKQAIRLRVQMLYDGEDRSKAVHDLLTNFYTMVA